MSATKIYLFICIYIDPTGSLEHIKLLSHTGQTLNFKGFTLMPQILFEWLKKADHGIISTGKFMPQHKSLRDTRSLYKTSKLQERYRKYLLTLSMVINCIITSYDILLFSYFYFVHCTLSLSHVRISTHSRHTQAVVCSFAESVYFNINCHSTTATTRKPSHPLFTKLHFNIQFSPALRWEDWAELCRHQWWRWYCACHVIFLLQWWCRWP